MLNKTIETILRDYPETRSNDRLLQIKVWERQGFYLSDSQRDKYLHLPSTESVRRTRQKIQESGLYPASESVKRQRKFKAMQIQQMIPKVKSDKVERLVQAPMFDLPPVKKEFRYEN